MGESLPLKPNERARCDSASRIVAQALVSLSLFCGTSTVLLGADESRQIFEILEEATQTVAEVKEPQQRSGMSPGSGQSRTLEGQSLGLKRVVIEREQLGPQWIQQVVAEHVGHDVAIDGSHARLSTLSRIDQFPEQLARHRSDRNFGGEVEAFFRRWQNARSKGAVNG